MTQQAMNEQLSPNVSRSRGRPVLRAALAIGLMVAAVFAMSWSLNTQAVKNALLRQVEQRTGHRVAVEEMDLRLFPRPRLDLRRVEVFGGRSEAPLLSAGRLDMALQIGSLLEGRAAAAYVVLESPRIIVRRHPSGQWALGDQEPEATSGGSGHPVGLLALMRNLLIVDGVVTIVDQSGSLQPDPVHLASLQLAMTEELPGRSAKIQMSGEMPQGAGGSALFNIDGSLVVLNGGGRPPDAAESVQAEGTIRIHRLDLRHIAGWFGLRPEPADLIPPLQLMGHLRLAPRAAGYDLTVTNWRAGFSDVSLQGTATVTGLGTALSRVSADLSSSSVPLKQTLSQVPAAWFPADLRERLAAHAVDGFVSLHDTHAELVVGSGEDLLIAGTVEIRDGRFLPGGIHPAVRDLSATVHYDLKQIRVTDLQGNYGPVRLSDGTALITQWREEPLVDLRISGEVRAVEMIALLNNRERFSQFAADLAQLEHVTGEVGMVAHLAGQPGKGDLDVEEISVAIRNLGFRHQSVPVPFRQIEGRVRILPAEVHLDHLSGQAGFAKVEAGGRVTLAGEPSFHDMAVNVTADSEAFAPWLHEASGEQFRPVAEGPVFLSVSITGAVRTPRFQGRLTLDGTGFRVPHVFDKAKGAPAGIRFEGELREDRLLTVRRCELILPPVRLTGEGRVRLADDWEFRARVRSDALSVDKLPRGVKLGSISAGVIKAGLKLEGRAGDRASWMTTGRLSFTKGVVEQQFEKPIQNLTIGLRFDGRNIDVRRVAFTVGDSDIRLSGSIADWLEGPRAKLVVESSQLNIQSLRLADSQNPSSSSDSFPVVRAWLGAGSVEATILIDYAYYEHTLLTGLSCRARFQQGSLTIDRISGDTDDGHLGGRFVLQLPERGRGVMRTAVRVSGLPVERLAALIEERPRISGWMAARGQIQAEFGQDRLFRASVNSRRPISIIIERGHLYSAPVISKVLSLMNLPALLKGKADLMKDGMPLDRLKMVFGVEDGIINVSEFLLDSPVLKISATGRYDFMDDKFDGVMVASPLGQYSDLLKSVPLFGKLFAGERQGFDTAIFEVKGPAKDPNVVYLPAESLMAGAKGTAKLAFDLLVNAITLPKEAFSMADDSPVEEDEVQEAARGS
ncbi:MAG TPA: AsmA-like C-terminal domain-containing protein [Nitrospiraceae bacterium]|nr:AsmA-like C-terminal domain-containing protein [Nitrospiraceae bacterium]